MLWWDRPVSGLWVVAPVAPQGADAAEQLPRAEAPSNPRGRSLGGGSSPKKPVEAVGKVQLCRPPLPGEFFS